MEKRTDEDVMSRATETARQVVMGAAVRAKRDNQSDVPITLTRAEAAAVVRSLTFTRNAEEALRSATSVAVDFAS